MAWTIDYADPALRELRKLDPAVARRVVDFMSERVAKHPDPRSIGSPLTGPLLGQFWRYRVGDWRVICDIQDARVTVLVVKIAARKHVYR